MGLKTIIILFISFFPFLSLARTWQQGDPCPDYLKTQVPYGAWLEKIEGETYEEREKREEITPRFDTMVSVHEALSTCPNITGLDLRVSLQGCSGWPDRWDFPFEPKGGDVYPTLKELRLEGYDFNRVPCEESPYNLNFPGGLPWYENLVGWLVEATMTAGHKVKCATMERSQRNKTTLDLWLDAMDWSQLESIALLDYDSPSILKIADAAQSLRRLDLSHGSEETTIQFLNKLPADSLTHFTCVNRTLFPLSSLLDRHGKSLQSLEIRAPEVMGGSKTPYYNATDLNLLTSKTSNLTRLALNVHRNGTWPLETLELISSIPTLRSADLWMDMASECRHQKPCGHDTSHFEWERANPGVCEGEEQFQEPFVTVNSSLEIFNSMSQKSNGSLTILNFFVGDWERAWDGPLPFGCDWLDQRRAKVSCSMEGKADGEPLCIAEDRRPNYWTKEWRHRYDYDDDDTYDDEPLSLPFL